MVKNRNSHKQLEKKREGKNERITEFNNNKAGEMLEKGMTAREDALKEAGIMQEYNFGDHQHIYNYADDCGGAPIETIGDNIVRCSDCGNLKDGNLPEEEQCQCGLTKRGYDSSPSPSRSPSPEPLRKRDAPARHESVQCKPVTDAARMKRARRIFEQSMAVAAPKVKLTPEQAMTMQAGSKVVPESFSVGAKNEKATNFFLTPGARNFKSDNPAITPRIRLALNALADLTEFHHLGGAPGHQLSNMIEHGDALLLEHGSRLRELVDARRAQLRLWLDATPSRVERKNRKHREAAEACLGDISEF